VGSQIVNYDVFRELAETANRNIRQLSKLGVSIKHINFGGGVGVDYDDPRENPIVCFDTFFAEIADNFVNKNNLTVHFELGRSLVAQAGVLVSKVLFTKKPQDTNFAIIDAGMTELIRPALYDAQHQVESVDVNNTNMIPYCVVGPICECSDTFAKNLMLPKLSRGDLLSIYSTGAYGKVLASEYNLRPTVKEYFITRDCYATNK
jgi:diaminopimelate decarboxylase